MIGNKQSPQLEEKQRQLLNELIKIIALTPPNNFFDALVEGISKTLHIPYVLISEFLAREYKISAVSFYHHGEIAKGIQISLENTPCEHVIGKTMRVYPECLRQAFPKDLNLAAWKAESYLGVPLFSAKREPLGHIAILDINPLQNIEFAKYVLEVCAMRVSAELDRTISDRLIRESEQQLRLAQEVGKIGSYHFDLKEDRLVWSDEMKAIFGVQETPTQEQYWELIYPEDIPNHQNDSTKLSNEKIPFTSEVRAIKGDSVINLLINAKAVLDESGQASALIGTVQDITDRKQAEEKIYRFANYDSVTNLPNRHYLEQHLQHSIALAQRQNTSFSLMYFDLNRFKDINDILGHYVGDKLLLEVGNLLGNCLRQSDVIARLGGDEFACVLYDADAEQAANLAQRLLLKLEAPFYIQDHTIHTGASIGIASYPKDGTSIEELFKNADIAMYRAKTGRKSAYACFRKEDSERLKERVFIERALIEALKKEQFSLSYQPRFSLMDSSIDSLEALLRWKHPQFGDISPSKFIPIAEEVGLIHDLGKWVFNKVCHQSKTWQEAGLDIRIAVNLSAKELQRDDITKQIEQTLANHKLNGQSLELEITESAAMSDQAHSFYTLGAIKNLGLYVAIDDFGTGYSSLSHLKRLPVDYLKVDRSFVKGINQLKDSKENIDAGIVRMILTLAQSLNLVTVAEGVETESQRDFLIYHGCDTVQGYLYSKPLPVDQIERLCYKSNKSLVCKTPLN